MFSGGVDIAQCDDGPCGTQSEDFMGFHNIKDLTVSDRQEAVKQTFPFKTPAKELTEILLSAARCCVNICY